MQGKERKNSLMILILMSIIEWEINQFNNKTEKKEIAKQGDMVPELSVPSVLQQISKTRHGSMRNVAY